MHPTWTPHALFSSKIFLHPKAKSKIQFIHWLLSLTWLLPSPPTFSAIFLHTFGWHRAVSILFLTQEHAAPPFSLSFHLTPLNLTPFRLFLWRNTPKVDKSDYHLSSFCTLSFDFSSFTSLPTLKMYQMLIIFISISIFSYLFSAWLNNLVHFI